MIVVAAIIIAAELEQEPELTESEAVQAANDWMLGLEETAP